MKNTFILLLLCCFCLLHVDAQEKYQNVIANRHNADQIVQVKAKSPVILSSMQRDSLLHTSSTRLSSYGKMITLNKLTEKEKQNFLKARATDILLTIAPDYYRYHVDIKYDEIPEQIKMHYKRYERHGGRTIDNNSYVVTFVLGDEEKPRFQGDGFKVYLDEQTGDFLAVCVPIDPNLYIYNYESYKNNPMANKIPYGNVYMYEILRK